MNKPKIIMFVGLPASGKSTYAKKYTTIHTNTIWLSSDNIRKELYGDEKIQDNPDKVFSLMRIRTKEALMQGVDVVWDSTNISYKRRMAFLNELKNIPCEKICVLMATPYEECLKRNAERERKVPEYVIKNMYFSFNIPCWYEGWDDIRIEYADGAKGSYGSIVDWVESVNDYDQHNSHHTLTLGQHCTKTFMHVYGTLNRFWEITSAALIHDCGKPKTATFTDSKGMSTNKCHYYHHQYTGAYDSLFFSDIGRPLYVAALIMWHMQPYFWERDNNEKLHAKYRNLWGELLYEDIMKIHEADKAAH